MAKNNNYKPSPTVEHFNEDVRNNEILAAFNKMADKRLEVRDQFNVSGKFPTSIPAMKGGGSRKSNGGK
jgi:hypothetical protein